MLISEEKEKPKYSNKLKTQEEFKKEVYDAVGEEYSVIGKYVNRKTKILMRHNICNRDYPVTPTNFISCNNRCPLCRWDRWKGEDHPKWKNGISGLHSYLRYYINEWKQDLFKRYNYKCYLSNKNNRDLQIHHFYNYSQIILDVLDELQLDIKSNVSTYTIDELEKIVNLFVDKHVGMDGVCLSKPIHILFHHIYGNKNNSKEQFDEFRQRYNDGEFIIEIEKIQNKETLNLQKEKQEKEKYKVSKTKVIKTKTIKTKLEKVNGQEMKRCSKCKEILPASKEYFYGDKTRTDGLMHACKKCNNKSTRKKSLNNNKPRKIRGEATKGIKNTNAKLTEKDVLDIVSMLLKGIKHTEIVKYYNIDADIISHIKCGRRWAHLIDKDTKSKLMKLKSKKLNVDIVREIKIKIAKNENIKIIAEQYEVSVGSIRDIKNNKTWKNEIINNKDLED